MSDEMKKATARRIKDWRYANRWFVGVGLDIGCGGDPISRSVFTNITFIRGYDSVLGDGDAQYLPEFGDSTFDFVVSSHCLEHMVDVNVSMRNWLRVLKPRGYLVVTIPEWDLYEHRHWPSKFNGDHKWSWTLKMAGLESGQGHVLYVPTFLAKLQLEHEFDIEMVQLLTEHFDYNAEDIVDQTGGPAECSIEFILRKV